MAVTAVRGTPTAQARLPAKKGPLGWFTVCGPLAALAFEHPQAGMLGREADYLGFSKRMATENRLFTHLADAQNGRLSFRAHN